MPKTDQTINHILTEQQNHSIHTLHKNTLVLISALLKHRCQSTLKASHDCHIRSTGDKNHTRTQTCDTTHRHSNTHHILRHMNESSQYLRSSWAIIGAVDRCPFRQQFLQMLYIAYYSVPWPVFWLVDRITRSLDGSPLFGPRSASVDWSTPGIVLRKLDFQRPLLLTCSQKALYKCHDA